VKESPGDSPAHERREEGWESVLVWNATVARIPAPAAEPDSAERVAGVEGGDATPIAGTRSGASSRRSD
jgi:hypothetical protein